MCCCEEEKLTDEIDDNHDCDFLDTIYEKIFECDFDRRAADDYLEKGWTINSEGFYKSDSDFYNEREIRVFPTRYRLDDFVLTKSLRRILRKNSDLKILVRPFRPTKSKDDLYLAHLKGTL